jgi:hypothetical protein
VPSKIEHFLLEIATKCDAPLNGDIPEEDLEAAKMLKSQQRIARALFNREKIPDARKQELKETLKKS